MKGRQLRSVTRLVTVAVLVGAVVSPSPPDVSVSLTHISTLYLPQYGEDGSLTYSYPADILEQVAVDPSSRLIYGVGNGGIYIVDASDVSNLTLKEHVTVRGDLELTDVELCGDGVFISYSNVSDKMQGGVRVYTLYNATAGVLRLLQDIPVGSLPDMIKATSDCTLVVALENEGFVQGGQFYDPPGGVGIIRFPSGVEAEPEVKILNFTQFDAEFENLTASGVRWVYRGHGTSFSDNVEPEYVAFSHDYSKAYIGLQENNAIAVVDLSTDSITGIYGLGFKSWGELDPSDKDGGVHLAAWPVYGLYQPDSIETVEWNGQEYLITANEGDAQEYPAPVDFSEEIRGKDIDESDIADSVNNDLRLALRNNSQLGRLTFSAVDGKNSDGQFERFYTYGARGISVWSTSDMTRVFDSGSDMEKELAQRRPDLFNSNSKGDDLVSESLDTRSDNKGPETESLSTGVVEGHLLIFAGNERPGTVAVYSVAPGGMSPRFQSLYTGGVPPGRENSTWRQLYDSRELHAIDPESIQFVPASQGLADFPVLLVGGSVSGTLTVLKVEVVRIATGPSGEDDESSSSSSRVSPAVWTLALCLLVYLYGRRFDGQLWG